MFILIILASAGNSVSVSIMKSLEYMNLRVKGHGGAVAVSRYGDVGYSFSTPRMPWAYVKDNQLYYGMHPREHRKENL